MSSTDTLTSSQTSTNAQVLDATTHANIHDKLARALGIKTAQVNAFVKLYDEGATVPFIARYRKEKTQNLDDAQLRALEKSLNYERDMATRRLKITELLSTTSDATVKWSAKNGKSYKVRYSYDLNTWADVVTGQASGADGEMTYRDTDVTRSAAPKVFYKVEVE